MRFIALLGLTAVPLVALAGVGVLVVALSGAQRVSAGAEERAVRVVRLAGILLGLALALIMVVRPLRLPLVDGLGVELLVAPALCGLVILASVIVGELLVRPRYDSDIRTADLRPRRIGDHLPPVLAPAVGVVAIAAAVLCTFTTWTARPDDMGREGRSLDRVCSAVSSAGRGPFPGSYYVEPYLLVALIALIVAVGAAWRVTYRPIGGSLEQADRHRRVGLRAITGAFGLVIAAPLVGIGVTAGSALLGHSCPAQGWTVMGYFSLVVAAVALVVACASLLAVVAPGSTVLARRTTVEREAAEEAANHG